MKIVLISDLHGSDSALRYLDNFLATCDADVVIAAGDITDRPEEVVRYLHSLLDIAVNDNGADFYAVHGNNDPKDVLELLEQMDRSLHLRTAKVRQLELSGIGGLADLNEGTQAAAGFHIDKTLFVTHMPPSTSGHENYTNLPLAHVSGHLHLKKPTSRKIGGVLHIQLGALKDGWLGVLEYPSLKVSFHNLKT